MSYFGVTKEVIDRVWAHPNADKLSLASLKGCSFQFVIGKDAFKEGDVVLYFPIDAVLPDATAEKIGLRGKLGGSNHDRIKTIRLRGQYSQGVVSTLSIIDDLLAINPNPTSEEITTHLGVYRFDAEAEQPFLQCKQFSGLSPLPIKKYDIEGVDRYPEIVNILMDVPVRICEKIEGTNSAYTMDRNGKFHVCQRNFSINPDENHPFWKLAKKHDIENKLKNILSGLPESIYRITVRGEFTGPGLQKNIYRLPEHELYVFDIEMNDGEYHPVDEFIVALDLKTVPLLSTGKTLREWLAGKTITEMADGNSLLHPQQIREGIVIKPCTEMYDPNIGRVILKKRSLLYLEKTGA